MKMRSINVAKVSWHINQFNYSAMGVPSIDVFSGIGGITLALEGYCTPVLYCDNERFCQHVLYERMVDGRLPSAPIHGDIRTLRVSPGGVPPQMIIGGFPCTDVSTMGLQRGINTDTRSGLFLEIMRLVDENPCIKVLFLENVSNIVRCGLKDVVDELNKRGFSFAWSHKSAGSMGAPHVRSRWFCLAVRDDADIAKLFDVDGEKEREREQDGDASLMLPHRTEPSIMASASQHWDMEPQRRYTYKPVSGIEDNSFDENWVQRCQTLGNTVCPFVVRAAFVELVRLLRNQRAITDIFGQFGSIDIDLLKYPFPDTGLVTTGRFYSMPSMNLSIKTAADVHRAPIDITVAMPDGRVLRPINYPTPRRGITYASALTERGLRDLPTVLLHSEKSLDGMARDLAIMYPHDPVELEGDVPIEGEDPTTTNIPDIPNTITRQANSHRPDKPHNIAVQNVNYVEWMMGYPCDWTKVRMYERSNGNAAKVAATNNAEWDDEDSDNSCGISDPQHHGHARKSRAAGGSVTGKRLLLQSGDVHPADIKYKPNGMHLLMRESKGMDVRAVSQRWRALSDVERREYSRKAKELVDPNAFLTSRACT